LVYWTEQVKGKLARFLAGMRAYERQHSGGQHSGGAQQPLPPVLSEFIAWAGDVLAGEQQDGTISVQYMYTWLLTVAD
jgi:hypothetical protein